MFYQNNPRVIEAADVKGVVAMDALTDLGSGDQLVTVVFRLDGRKRYPNEVCEAPVYFHVHPDLKPFEAEAVVERWQAAQAEKAAERQVAAKEAEAALAHMESELEAEEKAEESGSSDEESDSASE